MHEIEIERKLDLTVKLWHFAIGIIGVVVSGAVVATATMNRIENMDEYGTRAFQRSQERFQTALEGVRDELENLRESRARIEAIMEQLKEQFKNK
jgi:hypothetical protein